MSKSQKNIKAVPIPSISDDVAVRFIRWGKSSREKNFMRHDPRFSEEAMNKRLDKRSALSNRKSMKEILEKFGK